jgi:hypothetical protein
MGQGVKGGLGKTVETLSGRRLEGLNVPGGIAFCSDVNLRMHSFQLPA